MKLNVRASSLHAAVVGLCNAIIQAVSSFGVHLSGSQNVSITALVNSVLLLVSVLTIQATNGAA